MDTPPFLGVFFTTKHWWYVGVFVDEGASWRPLYRRGWMLLTDAEAEEEFVDTVEAYWHTRASKFMWKWVNGRSVQVRHVW